MRIVKITLGWTTPVLRSPEQVTRCSWFVIATYSERRLTDGLVDDLRGRRRNDTVTFHDSAPWGCTGDLRTT